MVFWKCSHFPLGVLLGEIRIEHQRKDDEPGADKNQTEHWHFEGSRVEQLSFHIDIGTGVCTQSHARTHTHTHTHTHSAMAIILKMRGEQFVYLELAWMRSLLVSGTAMVFHRVRLP